MPVLSDRMLARMTRAPGLRRWAARRAAARALHGPALAAAPDDPAVLALLGLYGAEAGRARDRNGRAGALVIRAAQGGAFLDDVAGLDDAWRRRLAAAVAARDPLGAAAVLPVGDAAARAACLLAAGDGDAARRQIGRLIEGPDNREVWAIRAAIAVGRGDHRGARRALNALFAVDGLGAVLDEAEAGFDIASLGGAVAPVGGELVSVVMPYRDAGETLAMAVGSLQRQSWRDIEVLLIDDGSRDGGAEIAVRIAGGDVRVRLLTNEAEPGVSGARNTGLAKARGAYVAFLDADDWAHPERIARQVAMVAGGAATVSRHIRIAPDGSPVAPRVFPMVRFCPISLLARRGAIEAAGPFEIARTGADAEYLGRLDLLFGRDAVVRDPAVLTVASWRAGSLSSDPERGLADPERFAYREDWMRRHAARWRAGGLPIDWRAI